MHTTTGTAPGAAPRRARTAGTAAALAGILALTMTTGCTGVLRSLSSDTGADHDQKADRFVLTTHDLALSLPGQWKVVDPEDDLDEIDEELGGSYEYDFNLANGRTVVRARAVPRTTIRAVRPARCLDALAAALTAKGWSRGPDMRAQRDGVAGMGFAGTRAGRYQEAWCYRSNHDAAVVLTVSVPDSDDSSADHRAVGSLLDDVAWRAKD